MSVTVLLTSILLAGFVPLGYTAPTNTTFNPVGRITALPCGKTDFETGWMRFTQDMRDSFNWSLGSGRTPTGKTIPRRTGPPNDHTIGNSSGKYVFINAKQHNKEDYASLYTPAYRTPPNSLSAVSFFFHMYGPLLNGTHGMGKLTVELITATQNRTIFTRTGNQGNRWLKKVYRLPNLSSEQWFQFGFKAKVGANERSDIALDDIDFIYGSSACCSGNVTFESGLEGWTQSKVDNFNWKQLRRGTSTNFTGPSADHTRKTKAGYYLYIEANKKSTGDLAVITSPRFDRLYSDLCTMTFWYHMYGSHIGSLNVTVHTSASSNVVWTKSGNQGNNWTYAVVRLPAEKLKLTFQISFSGVRGNGTRGDIAIDDVYFSDRCCPGSTFLQSTCLNNGQTICESHRNWSAASCSLSNWCENQLSCDKFLAGSTKALPHNCYCKPGFTGPRCRTNIDECSGGQCQTNINDCTSTSCHNSATCIDGDNDFICLCSPGYTGPYCKTDIDECSPNPCNNSGSCTNGVNSYTCQCTTGFTGRQCHTNVDECISNSCNNSGTCIDGVNNYTCQCTTGFAGRQCQTNINDCTSHSCYNSGTCIDGVNDFICLCSPGYTGPQCNTDIDECSSNPCNNSGSCTRGVNSYTCQCMNGFTGRQCHINIVDCTSNSCNNNGTCIDGANGYTCQCTTGFTGIQCQTNIDYCTSNSCYNSATCIDGVNTYTCQCSQGYTGHHCQTDIDACASQPCKNKGKCTENGSGFFCNCLSGYIGHHCETTTSNQQASSSLTQLQMTVIIGLAVVAFAIVLIVAVVLAAKKRRKQNTQQSQGPSETNTAGGRESSGHRNGKKQSKRCGRTLLDRSDDGECNAGIVLTNVIRYEDIQDQHGSAARCSHSDEALMDEYELPLGVECNSSHHAKVSNASTIESSFSNVLSMDSHEEHPGVHIEYSGGDSVCSTLQHNSETSLDVYDNVHPPHATVLQHNNESPQSNGSPRTHSQSEMSLDIYENAHPHQSIAYSPTSSAMQGPDDASIYNTLQHNSSPHLPNAMPKARPHSQTSLADYENVHLRSRSPSGSQAPIDDSIYSTLQHDSVAQQENAGTCSTVCDEIYDNPLPLPQGGHSQAVSSD